MRFGKITEGFALLPSIDINWYTWKGKRHYYVQFVWLFWALTTLKKFEWDLD